MQFQDADGAGIAFQTPTAGVAEWKSPVRGVRAWLVFNRVRSTRLAWGVVVWQQATPGLTTSAIIGKSDDGEKLNHERRNRIRKRALASKTLKRRCRTVKIRVGLVPRASGFVGGKSDASVSAARQESMACRKAAHTHADRVIIGPSDVTSESKTDTNAGSTAASGFGNSVHGLSTMWK